jgi:uncharacterized membrane protein
MTVDQAAVAFTVWAQGRRWDDGWEAHPVWWGVAAIAVGFLLLILLGWAFLHLAPLILALVAAVLGIRWLMRNTDRSRSDAALTILRERYARGDITKEEFDAKLRDLGGPR